MLEVRRDIIQVPRLCLGREQAVLSIELLVIDRQRLDSKAHDVIPSSILRRRSDLKVKVEMVVDTEATILLLEANWHWNIVPHISAAIHTECRWQPVNGQCVPIPMDNLEPKTFQRLRSPPLFTTCSDHGLCLQRELELYPFLEL